MLKPRFEWHCDAEGCCVFAGGTEDYDIYMGKCHEHPWDPGVIIVADGDLDYEFDNAGALGVERTGQGQHRIIPTIT